MPVLLRGWMMPLTTRVSPEYDLALMLMNSLDAPPVKRTDPFPDMALPGV